MVAEAAVCGNGGSGCGLFGLTPRLVAFALLAIVMAGLVPAIHVGPTPESLPESLKRRPDVDPRDKPGDDGLRVAGDKCQNRCTRTS